MLGALNEELTEHLGHDKHRAPDDRESTPVRNGTRPKTVLTEATGQVEIEVPRHRDDSFQPQFVKKRRRNSNGRGVAAASADLRSVIDAEHNGRPRGTS